MCDYNSLRKAIQGSEIIYHCAGSVSFEKSRSHELILNNLTGTANIVRASMETGIEKLCHVSSSSALGATGNKDLVNESHQWNDSEFHTAYAISKYRSESAVWDGIKQGLCAVIVNPSVIFGPGDWNKGSLLFFSKIANGMPFCTTGTTGYVDVRDVVTSMITLTNSSVSGERFIVSSENLSYREVISMIADSLAVRKPFVSVPELLSLPLSGFLALIPSRIRNRTSVTPEILHAAFSKVLLDNTKIRAATNISFIPISKSVEDTSRIFSAERQV
jgi:nucleoside-diphosphate-sugar epimerase